MSKTQKQLFGRKAENQARKILQSRGYSVVATNFYSKFGEIDIVAIDQDTLVFIEVKARKNTAKGFPEDAVGRRKIENIKKASHIYNQKNPNSYKKFRIDIVSIVSNEKGTKYKIIKGT